MDTRIGILTVSDTRSLEHDGSGDAAESALHDLGFSEVSRHICKDDVTEIQKAVRGLAPDCGAIFTLGGTGFAPRDVTPEATAAVLDRRADSLSELIRFRGFETSPFSHLSRGVSGIVGACLVVNLPGSPKAAREGIAAIAPLLPHVLASLAGDGCRADGHGRQ